jgi:hypothetical protein
MPSAAVNGTLNMWYSWQVGSIYFAMIDTETDYPGAPNDDYASHNGGFGDQMAWLRADLASAYARRAAGEVSWIIVAGHRPLYSVASADATTGAPTGGAAVLATAVEGLFNEYGVDLYVSGHVHGTEVQWPVFNTTHVAQTFDNPPYPTYLVVGELLCYGVLGFVIDWCCTWFSAVACWALRVLVLGARRHGCGGEGTAGLGHSCVGCVVWG